MNTRMPHTREQIINDLEDKLRKPSMHGNIVVCADGARDALALLKQPTLTAEPTDEMLLAMARTQNETLVSLSDGIRILYVERYKALYALLTAPPKPKTKRVKVWRVEHFCLSRPYVNSFLELHQAVTHRDALFSNETSVGYKCISDIIEAEQEVPA